MPLPGHDVSILDAGGELPVDELSPRATARINCRRATTGTEVAELVGRMS